MPFSFPNLKENNIRHANLQNGRLWAFTGRQGSEIVAKQDLSNTDTAPQLIQELILNRKAVKKMFVSRSGEHCIMLAEHEIFYNNWAD